MKLHVEFKDGRVLDLPILDDSYIGSIRTRLETDPTVLSVSVSEPEPVLVDEPEPRVFGGWVHRAALGTLPTFATLQSAHAFLPERGR